MSSVRKLRPMLVTAAVVVAVLLAVYVVPRHRAGGSSSSDCRTLSVAARVPSVAMDHERGVAYLSYIDVPKQPSGRAARGTIMLMDLNVADPRVRAALVTDPPDFQPVAVSLYAPKTGPRRLFVIDRGSAVQIFEQSASGGFERVKTVQDALFSHLTAISPTGPESFYVANQPRGWFGKWRASALLYDGTNAAPVKTSARLVVYETAPENVGAYVNAKARKSLRVLERDGTSELQVCPAGGVMPSS